METKDRNRCRIFLATLVLCTSASAKAGITLNGGRWTVTGAGNGGVVAASSHLGISVQSGAGMTTLNLSSSPSSFTVDIGVGGSISSTSAIVGGTTGNIVISNAGAINGSSNAGLRGFGASVTIQNSGGTSLIAGQTSGIDLSAGGVLTFTNSGGIVRGSSSDAIVANDDAMIDNSGLVESLSGDAADGIDLFDRGNISNAAAGRISGADDGIDAGTNTIILNSGTILGIGGRGIGVLESSSIKNLAGGIVQGGGAFGLTMLDNGTLQNAGSITAADGTSVSIGFDSTVTNSGIIQGMGSGDGIAARGGSVGIGNLSGGLIVGGLNGVVIDSAVTIGVTHITNAGIIRAGDGQGISAIDTSNLRVVNEASGAISSSNGSGVFAGRNLSLTNAGQIHGDASIDSGVTTVGGALELRNTGVIDGLNGITISDVTSASVSGVNVLNSGGAAVIEGKAGDGVSGQSGLVIHNLGGAKIMSTGGSGLNVGAGLVLRNNASQILGDVAAGAGVISGGGVLQIENLAGGIISGQAGIQITDVTVDGSLSHTIRNVSGSLIKGFAGHGIEGLDGLKIANLSGSTIQGIGGDGISLGLDAVILNNSSTIFGDASSGQGITVGGGALSIQNLAGSTIKGSGGLSILSDASGAGPHLLNSGASFVEGLAGNGVTALNGLVLHNLGGSKITSVGGDAINAGEGVTILNNTGSVIFGDAASGFGVTLTGGSTSIQNLAGSTIKAMGGIKITDDVTGTATHISNQGGSLIDGLAGNGVTGLNGLVIANAGASTVRGTGGDGISVGTGLVLRNEGSSMIIGDAAAGAGVTSGGQTMSISNLTDSKIEGQRGVVISGNLGAVSAGTFHVVNDHATISGLAGNGVEALDALQLSNQAGALIRGISGDGISSGLDVGIVNKGASTIRGDAASGRGIFATGGLLKIQNTASSVIDGMVGIQIDGDTPRFADGSVHLVNSEAATITGLAGHGVWVQTDFTALNATGGRIQSTGGDGINAGDNLSFHNESGSFVIGDIAEGVGVNATGGTLVISNSGTSTIEGMVGIQVSGDVTPLAGDAPHILNTETSTISGKAGHGVTVQGGVVLHNLTGGTIVSIDGDGVNSGDFLVLRNDASFIAGDSATGAGVRATGETLQLRNMAAGNIKGFDGVVVITGAVDSLIENSGGSTIEGIGGDGINGMEGLVINNLSSTSLILGNNNGIQVGDTTTTGNQGNIRGTTANGLLAGNLLGLTNDPTGLVEGGQNGVVAGDDATVAQSGRVTGLAADGLVANDRLKLTQTATGSVVGAKTGVTTLNTAIVDNSGKIEGRAVNGLKAANELQLDNRKVGTVKGAVHGVQAEDNASARNFGLITAGTGAGVEAKDALRLTNLGAIKGRIGVATLRETRTGGASITNHGDILARERAIVTGRGNDFVDQYGTLKSGSGTDMDLGAGNDLVILNSGVVSTGKIIGGSHDGADRLVLNGAVSIKANVIQVERTDTYGPGYSNIYSGVVVESNVVSINSGRLHLDGQIRRSTSGYSEVFVRPGAHLSGNGVVKGSVFVSPNAAISPGTLTAGTIGAFGMTRDLQLEKGSLYTADINGLLKTSDVLRAGGYANVAGSIALTQQGTFERGDLYKVVTAQKVNGRFTNVYNTGITPTLNFVQDVSPRAIQFEVRANMAGLPGLTPHERTIAAHLDKVTTQGNPSLRAILSRLDYSDPKTIRRALSRIDPVVYGASGTTALQHSHTVSQMEGRRLESLRGTRPQGDGEKGGPLPEGTPKSSIWFDVSNSTYNQDPSLEVNGFDANMTTIAIGVDKSLNDETSVGAFLLGYQDSFKAGPWGSDGDTNGIVLGVHGTRGYNTGLHLDVGLSAGYSRNSFEHRYSGIASASDGNSEYGAFMWRGAIGTGYRWKRNSWTFGPLARFSYAGVYEESTTENGSKGLDLKVGDRLRNSARGELGFSASSSGFSLGSFRIVPSLAIAYAHEFIDQSEAITGTFIDADIGSFRVRTPNAPQNSLSGTFGLGVELSPLTTLNFSVSEEKEVGKSSSERRTFGGSMSVKF